MKNRLHSFHIPVMGTGHSLDTPIRLAHLGITSVISIVDDLLLEQVRAYYARHFNLPYARIERDAPDCRAKRTTAYLDMVREIVGMKMAATKALPFFEANDKAKYFELLPAASPLRQDYDRLIQMAPGDERDALADRLTAAMRPGSVDVNIMVKLDKVNVDAAGNPLPDDFSDARASLRGFAESGLDSAVVFSAGINKGLFSCLAKFRDFYRDAAGAIRKKIILKVSDFRSAMIQGRFLAKKGLEVHEYRIESGLNCGGHAFATNGHLLPVIIEEFRRNRSQLREKLLPDVKTYYEEQGWPFAERSDEDHPRVTVQGGLGVSGEDRRMKEYYGMDATGWATPFLLVPEATPVDETTRKLLAAAGVDDLYTSDASPLGVPFNNVRGSGAERWALQSAESDAPGSACGKRYLISNTEFTERPICTASRAYLDKKLAELERSRLSPSEKARKYRQLTAKQCLCGHLGNSALITLGVVKEASSPQCVCPGPNIAWFDRTAYSLREMVDHIYGRGPSLVSAARPHVFANELNLYVDYLDRMAEESEVSEKSMARLADFAANLEKGMALCLALADEPPYPGENLESLREAVEKENKRLKSILFAFKKKVDLEKIVDEPSGKSAKGPKKASPGRSCAEIGHTLP